MAAQRIWTIEDPAHAAQADNADSMVAYLGIEFTGFGDDWLGARMPVAPRTQQPAGLLHGGASLVLAETLASAATYYTLDRATQTGVGLEINANHLRAVSRGHVHGRATPLHRGRTTQVWEIRLQDDDARLTCIARCTMAVLTR